MEAYNILSPDQIKISPMDFATEELAWRFFDKWKTRFENQGYYSSNEGRIKLEDLKDKCKLVKQTL